MNPLVIAGCGSKIMLLPANHGDVQEGLPKLKIVKLQLPRAARPSSACGVCFCCNLAKLKSSRIGHLGLGIVARFALLSRIT